MQQLTLFDSKESGRVRFGSRPARKRVRTASTGNVKWTLWAQETEAEKEMALFFLDIRNFTLLTAKHQPYDVIHIMKKLFATFQNIIRIHHGRIIETTGDGFYAAFGFERNVSRAVNDAVQAGMVILNNLEQLNTSSFEKNLHQRIDIGIGVHVGKVACDTLRVNSKEHFVVMGYPVNVASRLQAATKELNNNFIVSADVFKLLDSPPPNEKAALNLKGVKEPSELYMIGKAYAA